jgi:hypothetical protein
MGLAHKQEKREFATLHNIADSQNGHDQEITYTHRQIKYKIQVTYTGKS